LAQAALAMVLLMGAGLFVASLQRVRHLDLGVDTHRVVVLNPRWPSPAQSIGMDSMKRVFEHRDQFAADVVARLRALADIEHASLSVGIPFRQAGSVPVRIPGLDSLPRLPGSPGNPDLSKVSADYFATVGTHLIRGRLFTDADRAGSAPVAIVSKTMAEVVWPGRNAIGQCLLIQDAGPDACTYVVGVVQDTRRFSVREEPSMHYYLPLGQGTTALSGTQILVRPRGDAAVAIPTLRQLIRQLDPSIRFVDAQTLQDLIAPQIRSWEVGALMFSLFAGLALVVAAVGLFSVVAYLVEQRRHEIGVRLALGARASDVVALVMSGTVTVVVAGVFVGGTMSVIAGRLAQPLLFETNPSDPRLLGALAVTLLLVSIGASGVPALRARRVDAMTALRGE
jgi:predicted permease